MAEHPSSRKRACSTETLKVTACLRWRHLAIRRWSGTLSIVYGMPGDAFETLALEPTWDGLGPVRWRAFTRAGVVKKLRRYCERQGHVVEWTEVLGG